MPFGLSRRAYRKLAFAMLAIFLGQAQAECSKTLTISSSDYAPYVYRDKAGKWTGLDVELMQAIFKEADCRYKFAPLVAPKYMVERVSTGKTDILLAASDSQERRAANTFGIAYRQEVIGFFALSKRMEAYRDIKTLKDLLARKEPLLLPNAGWFGEDYANALPAIRADNRFIEFTYFDQGVRMLAAGRAAFIMSDMAAITYAAKLEKVAVEALPFAVHSAPVHMMFSKRSVNQHDIDELNAATSRLEQRGTLKTIRNNYGIR